MRHEFLPAARDEFIETAEFYEAQRGGLGVAFRDAVEHTITHVTTFPEIGRASRRGARRTLVIGFPYDLVYLVAAGVIVVVALAHHSRRPGYWKNRVRP